MAIYQCKLIIFRMFGYGPIQSYQLFLPLEHNSSSIIRITLSLLNQMCNAFLKKICVWIERYILGKMTTYQYKSIILESVAIDRYSHINCFSLRGRNRLKIPDLLYHHSSKCHRIFEENMWIIRALYFWCDGNLPIQTYNF